MATIEGVFAGAKAELIKLETLEKTVIEIMSLIQDTIQMTNEENPMRNSIDADALIATQLPLYNALKDSIEIAADALGTDN